MPEVSGTAEDVARLRTPALIRERARALRERAESGKSRHFRVHVSELPATATFVAEVTRENYPTLEVPIHGRLRHFDAGVDAGRARIAALRSKIAGESAVERARTLVDLVVPSVLLDAGSGPGWSFTEPGASASTSASSSANGTEGARLARSEGLAVASLHLFQSGAFAGDGKALRTDAAGLARLDRETLARGFQVTPDNPLIGVDERLALLHALGKACAATPNLFGESARPGGLVDALLREASENKDEAVPLTRVFALVLEGLSSIWPGRLTMHGQNLGDAWTHSALGSGEKAIVPFHKLSQWLTYSLVEPLLEAGIHVTELDGLTGLPEYRNGGLLFDSGVLSLVDEVDRAREHLLSSEFVVEWRALTVSLLDDLFPLVRDELDRPGLSIPSLLEGGTWAAGRKIAAEKRPGGTQPFSLTSDGTVF